MLGPFGEHWGYAAIVVVLILGNVGLPVPEEAILTLSGYLVWRGDLQLALVLLVGIVSAVAGDNLGYRLGRRFGREALARHGRRVGLDPARLEAAHRFVQERGALAVFAARFLPGLRFAAGPVAGAIGMPASIFFVANALGASLYVPAMVGVGYAVGRHAGWGLEQVSRNVVHVELIVLVAAALVTVSVMWRRARRQRRAEAAL